MTTPFEELLIQMHTDMEVEEALRFGRENPLPVDEKRRLLTAICRELAKKKRSNMPQTEDEIAAFVEKMIQGKEKLC